MDKNYITLYADEFDKDVWEDYCVAAGVPLSATDITIYFNEDEVEYTDGDEEELEFELMVVYRGEEEPSFVDYFESLEDAIDYASNDPDIAHYQVYDSNGAIVAEDDWDEGEQEDDDDIEEDY